jgi:error-prone DNA polymerase
MPYAELHCKTNFSFLEGASHPDELIGRAAELGYSALAVTDKNSLAGVVRAHSAAKDANLKLLIGAEITPRHAPPIVLWVTDRRAYGNLARLITVGRRRAPKGECELTIDDIASHAEGILVGIVTNPICEQVLASQDHRPTERDDHLLGQYRDIFADRCYLLAELHQGAHDDAIIGVLTSLARHHGMPLVAAGDVHYHVPQRMALQHVLTAIRHGTTVSQANELLFTNAQRHLRAIDTVQAIYAQIPDAIERTTEVAQRCHFRLDELRYEYPEELAPSGQTPLEYLIALTYEGAAQRYPAGVPDRVRQLLEHELALVAELKYEAYFLTVWDLVRFARSRGILCQGRGSAANSAVCYCLGVTAVDPDRTDVLFERFVSKERDEAPDIDVDFEHERREEVIQYLYDKYGRDRAGIAAEVVTYRARSAVRDVGKALGLSLDRVDSLAKQLEHYSRDSNLAERCRQVGIDPQSKIGKRLVYLVNELIGFPRHLSQHVGGMVITRGPLCELVPIENAAMAQRTFISWDKDDLDELGVLKVDCLALGMLTAIRRCFQMIEKYYGRSLSLADIPEGDAAVYDMICRADTMGVFQIESRAQMSMLPRLRPRCYYDLVIEVAIVRPGPIQGQMVHPYLRRRMGEEEVSYPNESIQKVLEKTLGVPIFQEQAMRLAVVAAGFTPGEADQLRRAMGAWRRPGVIDQFQRRLMKGMLQRGLSREFAERVVMQIRGFGEYGFPESHAASFALLVYVSAWLKHYYPAVFCAALINSQPMGFYAPAQLVRDARSHAIDVLPADVNFSDWECTLELPAAGERNQIASRCMPDGNARYSLRLGLRLLKGLAESQASAIIQARANGPFRSVDDFTRRTRLSPAVLMKLSEADAFTSLGLDRRNALWEALAQKRLTHPMPLFESLAATNDDTDTPLPRMEILEQVFADYQATGLSLKAHPVGFYREHLDRLKVLTAAQLATLPDDQIVRVAGLVILRQRPSTAKGITFVTLEDETGIANLVIHQKTWERFYPIARRSPAWIAHGRLQSKYSVIHVVVNQLEDLAKSLRQLNVKSRDFC